MKLTYYSSVVMCLFLGYSFSLLSASQQMQEEAEVPLVVAGIMVKNERETIRDTLLPLIKGGIKHFLFYDTGSTDDTVQTAKAYFQSEGITHVYIHEEPFINFAVSRNRSIDLVEKRFPNAVFLLMPDAEWHLYNVEGLLDFCKEHASDDPLMHSSYLVPITDGYEIFYTMRLIRLAARPRFVGAVHEALNKLASYSKVPQDVYFHRKYSSDGIAKSIERWKRDKELLLKEYFYKPYDPRTVFYLAQTCECLGQLHEAYTYYRRRILLNSHGWDEENYAAVYRCARVIEELSRIDDGYTLEDAIRYYIQAFKMRPHRAEALIKIAWICLEEGDMDNACYFAKAAARIPYPKSDYLFVEKSAFDEDVFDIISQCAVDTGEYALGEKALQYLIKKTNNTSLYEDLKAYGRARLLIEKRH